MPYLLLSVALLLLRVLIDPGRPRAARTRAYAPAVPAHTSTPAPAVPARTDHVAFCEVAEAHTHLWPEIRRLPGPLPYVAADRPNGIHIAADDLGAFAAALAAYPGPGRRTEAVRPYLRAHEEAQRRAEAATRTERAALAAAIRGHR